MTKASEDRDDVLRVPAAGNDPDSRQRLAKHLEAQGVELPDGLSTDAPTDEERQQFAAETDKARERREDVLENAAEDRSVAGQSHLSPPQGRAAPAKATTVAKSK